MSQAGLTQLQWNWCKCLEWGTRPFTDCEGGHSQWELTELERKCLHRPLVATNINVIFYRQVWISNLCSYVNKMRQSDCNKYWTYSLRYFHKVPAEAPLLELKASYGLVEPVAFELPPLSEQCTPQVYATFDLTKGAKNDKVLVHLWFIPFKSIENVWIL